MSVTAAIIYAAYSLMSVIWFWGRICPYCPHYETHACPCGYGLISSKLFERKNTTLFKQVFKRNILVVFPNWFVPFGIAVYLLVTGFSARILTLTIIFSITGFVIIPLISKLAGCKNCEIKDDCPWMTFRKGQNEITS